MATGTGSPSSLGGTIGGKIAKLSADAKAHALARGAPTIARTVNSVLAGWFRVMDREAQHAMGPLLRELAASPDAPPEVRQLLQAVTHPTGQWQMWLAQTVGGQVASGGLIPLIDNYFTPITADIIARNPSLMIGVGDLLDGIARGTIDHDFAVREAARQGINGSRFQMMIETRRQHPDVGSALEMWRRGLIGEGSVDTILQRNGILGGWWPGLKGLRDKLLTAEQLAEMWNRSIVDTPTGRRLAELTGVSAEDFDRLTELGGQPLAPQDLAEAFRRGFIDQSRFRRGIVQGPIRNEWFDVLEALQDRRMSPTEAAQAVLQGKMALSEGQQVARAAGLNANDFATIIESAGSPPGIATMQEAWNRGLIDETEFTEAFLESNLKNRWIDTIKRMRFRTMPREQINLTFRLGGFTRAEALRRYVWDGWSTEDAEAMMFAEEQRQLGTERDLSVSTVLDLYEGDAISQNDAIDFLRAMRYTDDNAAFLLAVRDIRKRRSRDRLAVSRVRSRYVAFRIDQREAENALDRIGVIAAERNSLIDTWTIEREISTPRLTTSQIQQAFKKGLIDADGALIRFRENGYSDDDAAILVALATPAGGGE